MLTAKDKAQIAVFLDTNLRNCLEDIEKIYHMHLDGQDIPKPIGLLKAVDSAYSLEMQEYLKVLLREVPDSVYEDAYDENLDLEIEKHIIRRQMFERFEEKRL